MCAADVSHLPTKITAKDREKQYPDVLYESGGKLFCKTCNVLDFNDLKVAAVSILAVGFAAGGATAPFPPRLTLAHTNTHTHTHTNTHTHTVDAGEKGDETTQ